jgi:hypothetical protein
MKFLCVPCDTPMRLTESRPPDRGSISLLYSCPACGYEFAMLTNAAETQVVGSLGVRVGPDSPDPRAAAAPSGGGCPFSRTVREMTGAPASSGDAIPWTPDAADRLARLPDFVRPMAKSGIEKFAQDRGLDRVDGELLDAAKDYFGM